MTLCPIYQFQAKTGYNVSEFMYLKWIMQSYYSSPNIKSLLPKYLIHFSHSVHNSLEHGLAILTESFSPLKSELHNLPC